MIQSDGDSDLQQVLDEAFTEYLSREDAGENVDCAEFVRGYPACADQLIQLIVEDRGVRICARVSGVLAETAGTPKPGSNVPDDVIVATERTASERGRRPHEFLAITNSSI